jgi:U3 small nucleolar RNA-associated protein MPP10
VSGPPPLQPTPLAGLFVDGADAEQVWAQLELKSAGLCDTLRFALDATGAADPDELGLEDDDEGAGPTKKARVRAVDEEEDLDMADLEDMEGFDSEEDEDMDDDEDSEETDDDGEDAESTDNEDLGEAIQPLRDPSEDEDEGEGEGGVGSSLFSHIKSALKRADKPKPARRGGHPELDDDFFSLAEFNAETERAEARKSSRGRLGGDDDDDEVPDTGEDLDLFAPVDEDGDDAMGEEPGNV